VGKELLEGATGWALGDGNHRGPRLTQELKEEGLDLLAPYESKEEEGSWMRSLTQKRRRIETVIGQRVECNKAKEVWALRTSGT
jgi:hypothetical protein